MGFTGQLVTSFTRKLFIFANHSPTLKHPLFVSSSSHRSNRPIPRKPLKAERPKKLRVEATARKQRCTQLRLKDEQPVHPNRSDQNARLPSHRAAGDPAQARQF
jgi:hypothetical protein